MTQRAPHSLVSPSSLCPHLLPSLYPALRLQPGWPPHCFSKVPGLLLMSLSGALFSQTDMRLTPSPIRSYLSSLQQAFLWPSDLCCIHPTNSCSLFSALFFIILVASITIYNTTLKK